MRRLIYITQFDSWWVLTEAQWIDCIRMWFKDETWSYDEIGCALKRAPAHAYRPRGEARWGWLHTTHVMHQPLDWDDDDWRAAAEEMGIEVTT